MGVLTLLLVASAASMAASMPGMMPYRSYHCVDKQGIQHPINSHFTRADGWKCRCELDGTVTRLSCQSPLLTNYPTRNRNMGYGDTSRLAYNQRIQPLAVCVANGQEYAVGQTWMMNGMSCVCNENSYYRCKSGLLPAGYNPSLVQRTIDPADDRCRSRAFRNTERFAVQQPGGFFSICSCVGTVANCEVPTTSSEMCQFPFLYNGEVFSTCTSQQVGQAPICVTSPASAARQTISSCITNIQDLDRYYGFVFTHGGNANGAKCHFPFTLGGQQHYSCVTELNRPSWCATTANYDVDGRYGYCRARRSSGTVFNRLGENVTLECRYDDVRGETPNIKWYKLTGDHRQHIYTYNGATQSGEPTATAGFYRTRISMPNSRQLQIVNMRIEDAGTFECDVHFPGRQDAVQLTEVSLDSSPTNLYYEYIPRNSSVIFHWTNPTEQFDSVRLEYQKVRSTQWRRVTLGRNQQMLVVYGRFRPGTPYQVRVITRTGGRDSQPASLLFTLPRIEYSGRRVTGQGGQTIPTADNPLAPPGVSEDQITLNWYGSPIPDTQVDGWIVVYEDTQTGVSQSVPLTSGVTSYTVRDLESNTRYRVTLFALVGENRIEIGSTETTTEYTPVELPSSIRTDDVTDHSVTLTWEAPESPVTGYEVAYRDVSSTNNRWRKVRVPASRQPEITLQNLMPSKIYDVHVTPITNGQRGVYTPVTVSTPDAAPVQPPANLVFEDIRKSSATVVWDAPLVGDVKHYVVEFEPLPKTENSIPYRTIAYQPIYYLSGLLRGKPYTFSVKTVAPDDTESEPLTGRFTTENKVCQVDGRWRGHEEKFYKLNPAGYMQNCTCTRLPSGGGRWTCDPIVCLHNGIQHAVGQTWTQLSNDGNYNQECTCLKRGWRCVGTGPAGFPQGDLLRHPEGGRLTLSCPHEVTGDFRPTIKWYKLNGDVRTLLYTYHGQGGFGHQETTAGDLSGRMDMPNEIELEINPVRLSDSGRYECVVTYRGHSSAPVTHRARILATYNLGEWIPAPQVTNSQTDTVELTWDAPDERVTEYIVKYTNVDRENEEHTVTVKNPSVELDQLSPSATYRITVIPVVDGTQGESTTFEVIRGQDGQSVIGQVPGGPGPLGDDEPLFTTAPQATTAPTAAPLVAPRPPSRLQFESKGTTSVTARWTTLFGPTVDSYRVEYKPVGSLEAPTTLRTRNNYLRVTNLEPGENYTFSVRSIQDGLESLPITAIVSPYRIGSILVQVEKNRRHYEVGDDATLQCRYDVNTPGKAVITWYKLGVGQAKDLIMTYDTATGAQTVEPGEFRGRVTSSDGRDFRIADLGPTDGGTYECKVTYPTGGGSGRTDVVLTGRPYPVIYTSSNYSNWQSNYTLSWRTVGPTPDSFILQIRRRGSSSGKYTTFRPPGRASSFLFRGLKPGRTYEGNMVAVKGRHQSQPSDFHFTTAASGLPHPPTGVKLSGASPNQVSVTVYGPRQIFDYYRIRYGPKTPVPGVPDRVVQGRNPSDILTLDNMLPDTQYVIDVTTVRGNEESEPYRGALTTPKPRPAAPTNLNIVQLEPREITFDVTGQQDDDTEYEIKYRPTTGITEEQTYRTAPGVNRVVLNLEPDTQYRVTVQAVSDGGQRSPILSTFIETPPEERPPSRPTDLTISEPGVNSVRLSWGGDTSNVQYYNIEYKLGSDTRPTSQDTPGVQQSAVINGLLPDSDYTISVKAVGQGGHSPKVVGTFHTRPEEIVLDEEEVQIFGSTPNDVTFQVPEADYYIVRYQGEGDTTETQLIEYGTVITLTDLTPGTRYRVTLIAVKDNIESRPIVKQIATPQEAPEPIKVADINLIEEKPDGFTLTVPPADYYFVSYRTPDGTLVGDRIIKYGPTFTLDELTPSTDYTITLTAVRNGVRSNPVEILLTTPEEVPNVGPSQPTGLSLLGKSPTEANFEVLGPTDHVDFYHIEWKPVSQFGPPRTRDTVNSRNEILLTQLIPSTRYRILVKAVKNNIDSQPVTEYFVTKRLPSDVESITPSNLRTTDVRPTQATVEWDQPSNLDGVSRYVLEYRIDNPFQPYIRKTIHSSNTHSVLTRLQPGTTYTVKLSPIKGGRKIPDAINATFTTPSRQYEPVPAEETTAAPQQQQPSTMVTTSQQPSTDVDSITPSNLRTTDVRPTQATVEWDQPSNIEGVSRYVFEYQEYDKPLLPFIRKNLLYSTTHSVLTRLRPATTYIVKLTPIGRGRQRPETLVTYFSTPSRQYEPVPVEETTAAPQQQQPSTMVPTSQQVIESTTAPAPIIRPSIPTILSRPASSAPQPLEPAPREMTTSEPQPLEGPRGLVVDRRGVKDADVRWNPVVDEDIDGFIVEYEPTFNRHGVPKTVQLPSTATEANLPDLVPGTEYQVRVYTTRGGQQSPPTEATFISELDSPTNVRAIPQDDRIVITWENPEGNITGTRLEYKKPDQRWRTRIFSPDVTQYVMPLSPDDYQYRVRVTTIGKTIESLPTEVTIVVKTPKEDDIIGSPLEVDDVTDMDAYIVIDDHVVPETGWILRIEDEEGIVGNPLLMPGSATSYPLTNLKPGHRYKVKALHKNGTEIAKKDFTTKADKPKHIGAPDVTPTSVTLTWEEPDSPIDGYTIKYRPVGSQADWEEVHLNPDVTGHTLTHLTPQTPYEVDIAPTYEDKVTDEKKKAGVSSVFRFATPASEEEEPTPSPLLPRAPSRVRFSSVSPTSISVRWVPSDDTDVDYNKVLLKLTSDGSRVVSSNIPTSYAIFSQLKPDTYYDVEVTAVRGDQESRPATGRVFTGANAPHDLTIDDTTPNGVTLSWQPEPGNSLVTGYTVKVRKQDSNQPPTTTVYPANTTTATLGHLSPGTPYEVSVTSNIDYVTTTPVTTRFETTVPDVRNVRFGEITENNIPVMWDQPDSDVREYLIDYWVVGNPDAQRVRIREDTNVTLDNLVPDTSYTIAIHSVHNRRLSNGIRVVQATNHDLGAPLNVVAEDVSDTTMYVYWQPFDETYRHKITIYSPNRRPNGRVSHIVEPGVNSYDVHDLRPSTDYNVIVSSLAPHSDSMRNAAPIRVTTKPKTPTRLQVVRRGPTSLVIEWRPVGTREYVVTYVPEIGGQPGMITTTNNNATLTNLQPNTMYVLTVQSVGRDNVRSSPAVKSAWTDEAVPLLMPENINVERAPTRGDNDGYQITWTLPQGAPDLAYNISYSPVSNINDVTYVVSRPGSTSRNIPNLQPGVEYVVRIVPVGESPTSDNTIERIFTTVLPQPENVHASEVTDRDVVVEWDAPIREDIYYTVRIFEPGHEDEAIVGRVDSTSPNLHTFTGLHPGRVYEVDVTSHSDAATSSPALTSVTTQIEKPRNVNARVFYRQVIVRWDAPHNDVTKYRVTLRPSNDLTDVQTVYTNHPKTSHVFNAISDLFPDTLYYVDVVAMNPGRGLESSPAQGSFTTLPQTTTPRPVAATTAPRAPVSAPRPGPRSDDTPAPIASDQVDEGAYNVSWRPPTTGVVQYYRVVQRSPNGLTTQASVPAHRTNLRLNNLSPNSEYTVTVTAVLEGGQEQSVGVLNLETTAPSSDRTVTIEWNEQGTPYESYRIIAEPDEVKPDVKTLMWTKTATDNHAWLNGLHPGTTYTIRVQGIHNGRYTTVSESTITTGIDSPANLTVLRAKPTKIVVTWDKPKADIDTYGLTYQYGTGPEVTLKTITKKHRKATIRGLKPGRDYVIRLYARSSKGESPPAILRARTPQSPVVTAISTPRQDSGVLVKWRSHSRTVQGWRILVEPQDGSEPWNVTTSRLHKRYQLENLKSDVGYTVTVYPHFGGGKYGTPSVVHIPASTRRGFIGTHRVTGAINADVGAFPWELSVPLAQANGVTLHWNQPWFNVLAYSLYYKRRDDPNSAYVQVIPGPLPGDTSATIPGLQAGEAYSIQLNATSADRHGKLVSTVTMNVATLLPEVSGVNIQSIADGQIRLSWQPVTGISNYVIITKERGQLGNTTQRLLPSTSSYTLPSVTPGSKYEIHFYTEKGEFRSNVLVFTITVPEAPPQVCTDKATQRVYPVGANWESTADGFRVICHCSAPESYECNTGQWCHADEGVFGPGDTWRRQGQGNTWEECVCNGKDGFTCVEELPPQVRRCNHEGRWHGIGSSWTSTVGGETVTCECRCTIFQCNVNCIPPNFEEETERARRESGSRGDAK